MTRPLLNVVVLAALASVMGCQGQPKSVADLRRLGDHALENGQPTQAAEYYAEYIARKPGEPDIRANYGRALLATNRYADAAEQLQIAYAQRPGDEQVLDDLCEAMLKADQQDALFRLLKANAADRGWVQDHVRMGRYSLAMGDTDAAALAFKTAAKIDKGQTVEPQLGLVSYYLALGDTVNAERRLRMAYFLAPMNVEVRQRIREMGPIMGPTFALVPAERGQ